MAEKKFGFIQALEILRGLDVVSQKRLLENLSQKDPELAEELKNELIQFTDLIHLTDQMIQELIKMAGMKKLALALRGQEERLVDHFAKNMSSNNKKDLHEHLLSGPKKLSDVQEAQQEILNIVSEKVSQGVFSVSPDKQDFV